MIDTIVHRGPDAGGVWTDDDAGIALGHRRLSIVDLSPAGAQPMTSASGRYVTVFNGEVYNFGSLRPALEQGGYPFRGHSDTEVLLASFDRWGVRETLPQMAGMFALAVWDREERALWLIRDRLGEKPLFYGALNGRWVFGSELKAIRAFPGWSSRIDMDAVAQYLRHGYIQSPASIYQDVRKVVPGTAVRLQRGAAPELVQYWSAAEHAEAGIRNPIRADDDAIADELDVLLRQVVKDEMVADVPLGAFLSGGIDSSLIVALMQAQSSRPVQTFTIGFDDADFSEAAAARAVAAHLGTAHHELTVSGTDALQFVDDLPHIYDEPMSDSSQLPTLLVSKLTRQHVTVAVSGDGGDELFGGYTWHGQFGRQERMAQSRPGLLRRSIGSVLASIPDPPPDMVARAVTSGDRKLGDRRASALSRFGAVMQARGQRELFGIALAQTAAPLDLLADEHRGSVGTGMLTGHWLGDDRTAESRMLFDAVTYLPDDVLVKVDRASMHWSLETRAPLLDHRVFEFAWRIPLEQKLRDGLGKRPLRNLLYRYVPRALVDRPKQGFGVPLAAWLRGPLRPWAEELVHSDLVSGSGIFNTTRVRRLWDQHVNGLANHADLVWTVLTLLSFLRAERASMHVGSQRQTAPARPPSPALVTS
jgi:asparagine synthase (glutamine-hydrolysing)